MNEFVVNFAMAFIAGYMIRAALHDISEKKVDLFTVGKILLAGANVGVYFL